MNDRFNDKDLIDDIADEIRGQEIDDASAKDITDRVWERLAADREHAEPLTSCTDFQREIPAYIAGTLPEARALLIGDHTRECVPCRRVLMEARGAAAPVTPRSTARRRFDPTSPAFRIAAAIVLVLGGLASIRIAGNLIADRQLRASVEIVDGTLQMVDEDSNQIVQMDSEIRSHQVLRTAKDSSAVLRLADGSLIELDERSELTLGASRRRTTISLARGNIIVQAADQGEGQLVVLTNDCEVAVRGTIFAVNHGLKGSRVSVLEGAVEVHEGATSALLRPGDQITTGNRLRKVPLEEEFSWSRDAELHRALLRELAELRIAIAEAVDHAPPRTSTFLLDLAPSDTLLYAAMPNLTGDLDEARAAFDQRLASSEILAEWWQEHVVSNGVDQEIDELIDVLQPIGEALGAEAVVAVPLSVIQDQGVPLFMAEVEDPASFRTSLESVIERANAEIDDHVAAILVEDPRLPFADHAGVYFWIEGSLFAATGDIETLRSLAERLDDPNAQGFVGSTLHTQLAETYAAGVSWLLGADLAAAAAARTADVSEDQAALLERLGLLDATTVVVERHRDGEWYATNAEVRFSEDRRGIMAWLAEPAPMGSLEFVSPDAYVVASAVSKDAEEMFGDLLDLIAAEDGSALEGLRLFEQTVGIDLRRDLAATIGGEATFALDGPMLPVPSWKLIVEVYDAPTLMHTIERAVALANVELVQQGQQPLVFEQADSAGLTFYSISREGQQERAVFTTTGGYLLAASSRALIEQAISQRASGINLTTSDEFRSLLPDNGYTDCSALVYRDLGSLIDAVPAEMLGELEMADALSDDLSSGLVCVFGENDRITASATGGSLVGLASTLGMAGATLAEKNLVEEYEKHEAVSSL